MNRRLAPRLAIVLALCAAVLVGMAFQDSTVTGWIRANAIRLTTPEAGHGFADMQPLKKLIGDARIVSLGEATHGSREFFQLKHRMLEFLASEMGFTVFSIEANMPEAYRVNDYVLHGTGDPAQLLRGMYFWTWDTEEVLAMIRWMREFNAEIDWAIQNARVVLQSLQMRANEVPRDRSMAENVKWTLDRNPRAKIVLWAHNGHVAAGGFSYETMGMALRRMYGAEMVIIGFAFNQGAFQAIPQGGGALKHFTVPPAPADSLDATLAAAGIPLFALDLRSAPAWFGVPRGSRQIGAVYPEDAPFAFIAPIPAREAYDAMLFIDRTTPARRNPGR